MYYIRYIIYTIYYYTAALRRVFITLFGVGGIELYMLNHYETESENCFTSDCLTRITNILCTPVPMTEINDIMSAMDNVIVYYMLKCHEKW
jgi:hypothetical protein